MNCAEHSDDDVHASCKQAIRQLQTLYTETVNKYELSIESRKDSVSIKCSELHELLAKTTQTSHELDFQLRTALQSIDKLHKDNKTILFENARMQEKCLSTDESMEQLQSQLDVFRKSLRNEHQQNNRLNDELTVAQQQNHKYQAYMKEKDRIISELKDENSRCEIELKLLQKECDSLKKERDDNTRMHSVQIELLVNKLNNTEFDHSAYTHLQSDFNHLKTKMDETNYAHRSLKEIVHGLKENVCTEKTANTESNAKIKVLEKDKALAESQVSSLLIAMDDLHIKKNNDKRPSSSILKSDSTANRSVHFDVQ